MADSTRCRWYLPDGHARGTCTHSRGWPRRCLYLGAEDACDILRALKRGQGDKEAEHDPHHSPR
jgi:hypothetical protein